MFSFFSKPKTTYSASTSSAVVVTTRTVTISRPKPLKPKETAPLTRPNTPPPAPAAALSATSKKRKRVEPVGATSKDKRQKPEVTPLARPKTTHGVKPPAGRDRRERIIKREHFVSPAPNRGSRSRSTSAFGTMEGPIKRDCYELLDGRVDAVSSQEITTTYLKNFKAYFRNLDDPFDQSFEPENLPAVELEYPNDASSERFVLLSPKDKDHYHPILELMSSLHTMIEFYLTPAEAAQFGTPPSSLLPPSSLFHSTTTSSAASTPTPSSPPRGTSPGVGYTHTSLGSGLTHTSSGLGHAHTDLLRTLSRSHYSRNGPLFVATVQRISTLMKTIKGCRAGTPSSTDTQSANPLKEAVKSWRGVPPKVWKTIMEETYQRSVGPRVHELKDYVAFSSCVYGELMPSFISDIVHRTSLGPGKNFLDLGSGVGNVVFQTALQSGCSSTGIEILPTPSTLASIQKTQFLHRCRLWGVNAGETLVVAGDFCDHPIVREKLSTADVVLVNNWAYSAELNERLSRLFLDMPENSVIVSLRPFLPVHFRLNEHTANTPLAILSVEEVEYRHGSVSWSGEGGTYYLNKIDRTMLRDYYERLSSGRPTGRTTRLTRSGKQ